MVVEFAGGSQYVGRKRCRVGTALDDLDESSERRRGRVGEVCGLSVARETSCGRAGRPLAFACCGERLFSSMAGLGASVVIFSDDERGGSDEELLPLSVIIFQMNLLGPA